MYIKQTHIVLKLTYFPMGNGIATVGSRLHKFRHHTNEEPPSKKLFNTSGSQAKSMDTAKAHTSDIHKGPTTRSDMETQPSQRPSF